MVSAFNEARIIFLSEALCCWFLSIRFVCFCDPPHHFIFSPLHYLSQEITYFPGGEDPGDAGPLCTQTCPTTVSSVDSRAALVQLSKADVAVTTEHLATEQKNAHKVIVSLKLSC